MTFAYADPPYIGQAHRYPEKREVDHAGLIARLVAEYPDGWALSCSSSSLQRILVMCPDDVRIMAWVKGFAAFRKAVRPQYAWEPVILRGGRRLQHPAFTCVRDWFQASMTLKRGLVGAKPEEFCSWILDCLGYEPGDSVVDLFPGTGVMDRVLAQGRLAL